MLDSVGMVRSERSLKEARDFLLENADLLDAGYLDVAGMELKNMHILSSLITSAATLRQESRGCHRRRDFPETDEWNWRKHIDARNVDGEIEVRMRPQRSKPPWELKVPGAQEE